MPVSIPRCVFMASRLPQLVPILQSLALASWFLLALLTQPLTLNFSSPWVSLPPASHSYVIPTMRPLGSLWPFGSWLSIGPLAHLSHLPLFLGPPLLLLPPSSQVHSVGHIQSSTFSPSLDSSRYLCLCSLSYLQGEITLLLNHILEQPGQVLISFGIKSWLIIVNIAGIVNITKQSLKEHICLYLHLDICLGESKTWCAFLICFFFQSTRTVL